MSRIKMDIDNWNTSRLILNLTKEEDFNELGPLLLNYETSKFIPKYPIQIRTIERAKLFFNANLFNKSIPCNYFTIRIKDSNKAIGQFAFSTFEDIMLIYYWIGLEFQGKGYASEAIIELSNHIFKNSPQEKFIISLHKNNIKSCKLANKIINYMLKENPNWSFLERDDGKEEFEVVSIDKNSVKLKQIGCDEFRIVDKSTFPDEFLEVGKKEVVDMQSLIISK